MIKSTIVVINSKDRINGSTHSFDYQLSNVGMNKCINWRVVSCTIPFSWYAIPVQAFSVVEGVFNTVVPFPAGSYTATEMANALQTALNASGAAGTFTVTYHRPTGKFTVSSTVAFTFDWDLGNPLPANEAYKNVGVALGFISETDHTIPAQNPNQTSRFVANLSGTTNVYIKSSRFQNSYSSYFNLLKVNVIQSTPVTGNFGDWLVWQNNTDMFYSLEGIMLETFDIQLVDDHNMPIDLNGRDWEFTLMIKHIN